MHQRLKEALAAGLILWGLASPAPAQAPVTPGTNTCVAKGVGCNFVQYGVANPLFTSTTPTVPAAGTAGAGYPPGATPVAAYATGTTAGATATLPAAAGKFTYLCGLHYEAGTATAAVTTNVTASNLLSGTFTSSANSPATAATATAGPIVSQVFTPCIPSSAVNTTIPVAAGALGTGGVNQAVNAWGYQQ